MPTPKVGSPVAGRVTPVTETMKRPLVAIAFHSGYGHTAVLAEGVRRGAEKAGAEVAHIPVDTITEEDWQRLDAADAVIFGSPTSMGGASAAFHATAEHLGARVTRQAAALTTGHKALADA